MDPLTPPASPPPLNSFNQATVRQSRLKFVLPSKPFHQSVYTNGTYQGLPFRAGMRVRLLRRTDNTVGTIRFIGEVDFADGVWIGVELDRRGKLLKSRKHFQILSLLMLGQSWEERWFSR